MSRVTFLGNGFDIRHNLKTSYKDFMDYCKTQHMDDNVLYKFYSSMKTCKGWYDFEQDLLFF